MKRVRCSASCWVECSYDVKACSFACICSSFSRWAVSFSSISCPLSFSLSIKSSSSPLSLPICRYASFSFSICLTFSFKVNSCDSSFAFASWRLAIPILACRTRSSATLSFLMISFFKFAISASRCSRSLSSSLAFLSYDS
jgi:hypothetical protein